MKPKISIITLGVADLEASLRFYRDGLGFPTHDYEEGAGIVFLALEGTWLALYPRTEFPNEAPGVNFAAPGTPMITLAHNVASKAEVDAVMQHAINAGATLIKAPQEVFWGGYSAYFADPDGHLWEVAHNPFTDLT